MATREEYIDKLELKLREWNGQLDKLQERAQDESEQITGQVNKRIEDLKTKRGKLQVKLNKIKESGEDSFDKIKADAETLWEDVSAGFDEVRSILKE